MKIGQEVTLVEEDGKRHTATVDDIVGSGDSLAKLLNLSYKSGDETVVLEAVPHEVDAAKGSSFWLLKGEKQTRKPDSEPTPDVESPLETPSTLIPGTASPPRATETRTPKPPKPGIRQQ